MFEQIMYYMGLIYFILHIGSAVYLIICNIGDIIHPSRYYKSLKRYFSKLFRFTLILLILPVFALFYILIEEI